MLILETRSRFAPRDSKWTQEDGTTRKEPTLSMRRLANEAARNEREIRYRDTRKGE